MSKLDPSPEKVLLALAKRFNKDADPHMRKLAQALDEFNKKYNIGECT